MRLNHARFFRIFVAICAFCCIPAALAQSYGEKLDGPWRNLLGLHAQDGAYQWLGFPTDNFGVMTLYRTSSGKQPTDADRICATWTCIGVAPGKIPADEFPVTTIKGFATVGLSSPLELTRRKQGRAAINFLLSNLLNTLSIDGLVDLPETAIFDLRANQIYRRTLNLPRFHEFLESSPDPQIRDARVNGELTYIAADIVARGLELTIDAGQDPQLAAQLTQAMAKLGRDGASGIRLSRFWRQTYVVQFPEFVVLATQLRHEPAPRPQLATGTEIANRRSPLKPSLSSVPEPRVELNALR